MKLVELLKEILCSLVDDPSAVHVNEMVGEASNMIEVKVAKHDVGKVIGKQGRIADALRTLVQCIGAKEGRKDVLQIVDGKKL